MGRVLNRSILPTFALAAMVTLPAGAAVSGEAVYQRRCAFVPRFGE